MHRIRFAPRRFVAADHFPEGPRQVKPFKNGFSENAGLVGRQMHGNLLVTGQDIQHTGIEGGVVQKVTAVMIGEHGQALGVHLFADR